jgi:hypothetical protein
VLYKEDLDQVQLRFPDFFERIRKSAAREHTQVPRPFPRRPIIRCGTRTHRTQHPIPLIYHSPVLRFRECPHAEARTARRILCCSPPSHQPCCSACAWCSQPPRLAYQPTRAFAGARHRISRRRRSLNFLAKMASTVQATVESQGQAGQ